MPGRSTASIAQVQRETSRVSSTRVRNAASNTAPSQKHERPSSLDAGVVGLECSAASFFIRAWQCLQHAGWLSFTIACATTCLTAHSYGQASTAKTENKMNAVRMEFDESPRNADDTCKSSPGCFSRQHEDLCFSQKFFAVFWMGFGWNEVIQLTLGNDAGILKLLDTRFKGDGHSW